MAVTASGAANGAAETASDAAQNRNYINVIVFLALGFMCCFWSFCAILFSCLKASQNQRMRREVALLQAQGKQVQMRDLKKMASRAKERSKLAAMRTMTAAENPEDDDWSDDDLMTDSEEVMRRTWQYKTLQFLFSLPTIVFILTVVIVDLMIGIVSTFFIVPTGAEIDNTVLFGSA